MGALNQNPLITAFFLAVFEVITGRCWCYHQQLGGYVMLDLYKQVLVGDDTNKGGNKKCKKPIFNTA
jgi:hypothetical protein